MKLLAVLVHTGRVTAEMARDAMASGDVGAHLIANGACSAADWQRWQRTEGDTRPELSRYELGELLGEGGVGRVFTAVDKTEDRKVALKVLRRELAADRQQADRFVQEARLLMALDHPHLVKGYRVAREGETIFFAMEIVPGRCSSLTGFMPTMRPVASEIPAMLRWAPFGLAVSVVSPCSLQ